MNVLFVTPYLPYPPISGGRLQTFLRLKYFKKRGHSVFLMTFALEDECDGILELKGHIDDIKYVYPRTDLSKIKHLAKKSLLYEIFTYNRSFGENLKSFSEDREIDIAVFEGLGVAQYRDSIPGVPSVLYEHNVEYEIVDQLVSSLRRSPLMILNGKVDEKLRNLWFFFFGEREKRLVRKFELNALKKFNLLITCSERDADILKKDLKDTPNLTIPWCVEIPDKFTKIANRRIYNLVFVGSMQWVPNRDAIIWFVKEVFPLIKRELNNIKLIIVGSYMSKDIQAFNNKEDIVVKGFVPDISKIWLETDIFIAPIRFGSGVNVKVIEAMSYGIPVITTSMGAEGIEAINGEHFIISNTPEEFLHDIKFLIKNPEIRKYIGGKARKYVLQYHSIDKVIDSFEDTLMDVIKAYD